MDFFRAGKGRCRRVICQKTTPLSSGLKRILNGLKISYSIFDFILFLHVNFYPYRFQSFHTLEILQLEIFDLGLQYIFLL